jgi:hypothetical protein
MEFVERLRDDEVDERVPEELEALVVARSPVRVLMEPAAVNQRPGQVPRVGEWDAQSFGELARGWRRITVPRNGSATGQLACSSM